MNGNSLLEKGIEEIGNLSKTINVWIEFWGITSLLKKEGGKVVIFEEERRGMASLWVS